jgi:hypothetical protein
MKYTFSITLALMILLIGSSYAQVKINREILPIVEPEAATYTELDVRNTKPPAPFNVEAPEDAPNVVIVLIDDLGFGATSTYGGPIKTPTMDVLANNGLRYNNFHTTALCSPTRMAIKTGKESSHMQHWIHYGDGHCLSGKHRSTA